MGLFSIKQANEYAKKVKGKVRTKFLAEDEGHLFRVYK